MFDDFESSHKAHIPEPELVPILDALTCVIFFLLLSTTFIELTKITVPPSQTSVITDPVVPPPKSPKLYVKLKGNDLELHLKWEGAQAGSIVKTVARLSDNARSPILEQAAYDLTAQYKAKYPDEKSLQMSLSEFATYQEMISVMDGVRKEMQDIVLLSPDDMKVIQD